jgi:Tol biopolymer transport system component
MTEIQPSARNVLGTVALGVYLMLGVVAMFLALAVASASSAARTAFPGKSGGIVFSGNGTLLWSVRADGSGLRRLASRSPSDQTETFPSFSPDGQRIAFIRGLGSSIGKIIIARPDGREQRRIFTGAYGVEWSPDGSELAVIGGALLIMRPDGSHRRLLLPRLDVVSLSWSPDGTRLPLAGAPSGGDGGCCLYTMRRNGSALRLIAEGFDIFSPEWSPEARQIAYTSDVSRGTVGPLTIVEADGSGRRQFGVGYHPAWSPDGSQIAFGNGGMWALEVATGFTRRVTEAEVEAGIDWQPLCGS